jgi:hypothetical protein
MHFGRLWSRPAVMKRSKAYALVAIISVVVWLVLKFKSHGLSRRISWYVDVAPWYSLIAFGSYCLARLGYDLLTFNDYPKEIKKLEQVSYSGCAFPVHRDVYWMYLCRT